MGFGGFVWKYSVVGRGWVRFALFRWVELNGMVWHKVVRGDSVGLSATWVWEGVARRLPRMKFVLRRCFGWRALALFGIWGGGGTKGGGMAGGRGCGWK